MCVSDAQPFIILPEEAVPPEVRNCECCELYKQRTRMVWGEGNPNASIMMIMDNPGAREDREGGAFVCGTRQTLQLGMREAGLPLDAVYVTYLLKRRPVRAYDKPIVREACLKHLHDQISAKGPRLLLGFGNVVSETLFSDLEDASVKSLRTAWQLYRDIPVTFTYHPLAVRRRPNLMKLFVEDLRLLTERWKQMSH